MIEFQDFHKQEMLDEAALKDAFIAKVRSLSDNIISKAKKIVSGLEYERKETMFMLETFFTKLKEMFKNEKTITDEDVKRALRQLGDVGKFSLIAPLFLLPGGGTTTAVLYMTGKKLFNISILPKGLEQVFEAVDNLKETLTVITEYESQQIKTYQSFINERGKLNVSK